MSRLQREGPLNPEYSRKVWIIYFLNFPHSCHSSSHRALVVTEAWTARVIRSLIESGASIALTYPVTEEDGTMTPTPRRQDTPSFSQRGRAGRHTAVPRRAFAPRLDVFEDRTLLSAAPITVMNLNDRGNGSLRAALADAGVTGRRSRCPRARGFLGTARC